MPARAFLISALLCGMAAAQVEVSLLPWPAGAEAALSLTFDDAYPSHTAVAMPLLEAFGFRGTFYLIVDRLFQRGKYEDLPSAPLADWQEGFRRGHEMGSHTWTHVGLDTISALQMQEELRAAHQVLEGLFPGAPVTSLAYPFSRADTAVMQEAARYYLTGRLGPPPAGEPPYNDPATDQLIGLKAFFLCTGETPQSWNQAADQTLRGGGWLVEALHPIDELGYCQVREEDLEAHLDYLAGLGGRIWVAPVGQVAARLVEWRTLRLHQTPLAGGQVLLALDEPADEAWQVVFTVAGSWRVLDPEGHPLPLERAGDSLRFVWPSGQAAVTLEPPLITAVRALGWGQLKSFFLVPAPDFQVFSGSPGR
ncbi:MAG: polysaccharide deacetylase family protein [Candidatus Handelsmanbacteria bacterium]|nr:polysaccharide deacetylase family protein [Candidatus Handelsmanbacteria bacterium]